MSAIPDSNDGTDIETQLQTVEYTAKPVVHGVRFYLQLDDENQLYNRLFQELSAYNSDSPEDLGEMNPDWLLGSNCLSVGGFTSATGWKLREKEPGQDVHLGLYDDTARGSAGIAKVAASTKLVLEPRMEGMRANGSELSWPAGIDGEQYYGTSLRIQCSFTESPSEALTRARDILTQALGNEALAAKDVITETFRFCRPEVYIRLTKERMDSVVQEMRSSARLVALTARAGQEGGKIQKGEYELYRFKTTDMEELGFRDGIPSDREEVLKVYQHLRSDYMTSDNPAYHPKLEATMLGGYHVSKWESVMSRARRVVLGHASWAGVEDNDFVADDYFSTDNPYTAEIPTTKRKHKLKEYYRSKEIRRTVSGRLFHSRTKSDHDILTVLLHDAENLQLSYSDLAQKTGLAKRTVRKRVGQMVNDDILDKFRSARTFVRFANDIVRETVRGIMEDSKTVQERREEVESRKRSRNSDTDTSSED